MIRFNKTRGLRHARMYAAMAVLAGCTCASAGTVDCFNDGGLAIDDVGPLTNAAGSASACAIGGARFASMAALPPNLGGTLTIDAGGSGLLDLLGRGASLQWTGATDPSVTPGLGGIDLTDGGIADRMRVMMRCNTNCFYQFQVFSEAPGSNYLLGSGNLLGTGIGSPFVAVDVLYSSLMVNGTGASLASVSVLRFHFNFNSAPQVGQAQFQVDWIGTSDGGDVPEPGMHGTLGLAMIAAVWASRRRSR